MDFLTISSTLLALVLVLFGAIVLLAWGFRGKRVGDAPHCRKCDYNVTGVAGDRCPECGSILTSRSMVIGQRQRRAPVIVVGTLLILASGGGLGLIGYGNAKKIVWYKYYPAFTLVGMAQADDTRAIDELIRRAVDGTLRRSRARALISTALEKHGANPASPNVFLWADLLALLDDGGWLSAEQQAQFYRQIALPKIVVRSKIRQGDWLVIREDIENRGSSLLRGDLKMRIEDYKINGDSTLLGSGEWRDIAHGLSRTLYNSTLGRRAFAMDVGNHKIECVLILAIFEPSANPETSDPLWLQELTIEGEVEILPVDAPDPIRLVKNEDLRKLLLRAITVRGITRHLRDDARRDRITASLSLGQPAPMCLAFKVFALTDDDEIEIGTLAWPKGQQGSAIASQRSRSGDDGIINDEFPNEVAVELRPSREAASESIDCFDVWDGTLRFGSVEVVMGKRTPVPTRAQRPLPEPRRPSHPPAPTGAAGDPSLVSWTWEPVPSFEGHTSTVSAAVVPTDFLLSHTDGLASNYINAAAEFLDRAMVFGTNAGLSIWRDGTLTTYTGPSFLPIVRRTTAGNSGLPGNRIRDLLVSKNDALWIATRYGVCRIHEGNWSVLTPSLQRSVGFNPKRDIQECGLSDTRRLFETTDGKIVIGSRCAGITILDTATDVATVVYYDDDLNHWCTGIAEDSRRRLWVALRGLGVARYDGSEIRFFNNAEEWIPTMNIRALAVDRSDNIWVGTHDGLGVLRADGSTGVFTVDDILPGKSVRGITVRRNGQVWCLTERGYVVFDGESWTYPKFAGFRPRRPGVLFETADGTTWMGGREGVMRNPSYVLLQENPAAQELEQARQQVEQDFPDIVASGNQIIDSERRVWLNIHDKLLRYDGSGWENMSSSIDSARISFLQIDSKGRVWVGTSGAGLIGFDGDEVLRFNNEPGKTKCVIYEMVEAADGVLYVGTQAGLYTLDGDEWECLSKQLLPDVFLQPHPVVLDGEGRVWFADANNGLFFYDGTEIVCLSQNSPLRGRRIRDLRATSDGKIAVSTIGRTRDGEEHLDFICYGEECNAEDDLPGE